MSGENDMGVGESFNDDAGDQSNSILNDLGGGCSEDGDFYAPKRTSKFSTQTIVIVSVLLVSSAMLYWMRAEATKAGVDLDLTPVDYIEQLKPKRTQQEEARILAVLNQARGILADLATVDKNPFAMRSNGPTQDVGTPMRHGDPAAIALRKHKDAIQKEFGSLRLQSVMTGRVNVARISGQMARIGDTIGTFFTVQAIGRSNVELIDEFGAIHVLTMAGEN